MSVVLRAGEVELTVDPADGGRWTSLRVGDLGLLTAVEQPGAWPVMLSGCFPLAPFAGRMAQGVLEHGGTRAVLPRHDPPHAIHGTVLDQGWDVAEAEPDRVVLSVRLAPPWPYAGTVRQELLLAPDRLSARLVLRAEEDQPVVLGLHPWFPRRLLRGGEAELVVSGGQQYLRGDDRLPTGELAAPRPRPWDDCFVGLDPWPLVRWPGALELQVRSSSDHWVLFDQRPDAVCIEPQTGPPDAVRLGLAPVVRAGEELALDCELSWRRQA